MVLWGADYISPLTRLAKGLELSMFLLHRRLEVNQLAVVLLFFLPSMALPFESVFAQVRLPALPQLPAEIVTKGMGKRGWGTGWGRGKGKVREEGNGDEKNEAIGIQR